MSPHCTWVQFVRILTFLAALSLSLSETQSLPFRACCFARSHHPPRHSEVTRAMPRLRTSCGSPFELCAGLSNYVHACMCAHVSSRTSYYEKLHNIGCS
eukprot:jgi/Botrbrau1/9325/Bobra.0086s0009.1